MLWVWVCFFFFSSRRRHTRFDCDWSSDVCSSDLGSGVVRMYRLRHVDGSPIAIERTLVPYSLLPDPESVTTSLYEALDAYGNRPKRALQRLRAVALDEEAARHLELPVGSPGLLVERRAFLDDGRVVESTRSYYRGDAYDFVAELQSD